MKKADLKVFLLLRPFFFFKPYSLWKKPVKVHLQAGIKITELLIDFDIALASLGLGHWKLSLSSVTVLKPAVETVHLSIEDMIGGFAVLRYGWRQGTSVHLHSHLQQSKSPFMTKVHQERKI